MIYGSRFLWYGVRQTKFFVILGHFLLFNPLMTCKMLKKNEENLGDMILLHMCIINDNHICMVPQVWTATGRIICHFGPYFALFTLLMSQKIKFWKTEKKILEILAFYICVPLTRIIWCMLPEIWSSTDIICCHFRVFFALLPPTTILKK